jgi:hypothetical protein
MPSINYYFFIELQYINWDGCSIFKTMPWRLINVFYWHVLDWTEVLLRLFPRSARMTNTLFRGATPLMSKLGLLILLCLWIKCQPLFRGSIHKRERSQVRQNLWEAKYFKLQSSRKSYHRTYWENFREEIISML